jgi:CubicO group peptidase (beta-lactamase class C family)
VDLWAGHADKDGNEPWHSDTLANLFSCTKTFTAVTALQLVGEGKLDLDGPVARYWPEFAAAGKERITLRQLLSHQAGLPAIHANLPGEALYDWQTMTAALAAQQPWWTPGQGHGYAPITYGWLVGELLRRVDGRGPGGSIVARTARPARPRKTAGRSEPVGAGGRSGQRSETLTSVPAATRRIAISHSDHLRKVVGPGNRRGLYPLSAT